MKKSFIGKPNFLTTFTGINKETNDAITQGTNGVEKSLIFSNIVFLCIFIVQIELSFQSTLLLKNPYFPCKVKSALKNSFSADLFGIQSSSIIHKYLYCCFAA